MNETFNQYRAYLFSIAYRMLGSVMDAEDMVQESFLRWQKVDAASVESPKSFLATIVTRLCIDHLRSTAVQREEYIGPWLPEPLVAGSGREGEEMVALADTLSIAFLTLLERLSPTERAVFLLRDVFDYEYGEIAAIVEKNEANCRQILRRARQHIADDRPRFDASLAEQQALALNFWAACQQGDMTGMMALLAEDVVEYSDGGGQQKAAMKPIYGADKVARFMVAIAKQAPPNTQISFTIANGQPAMLAIVDGRPFGLFMMDVANGRIQTLYSIVNPDKLRHISIN